MPQAAEGTHNTLANKLITNQGVTLSTIHDLPIHDPHVGFRFTQPNLAKNSYWYATGDVKMQKFTHSLARRAYLFFK
jgi:hypothetical protein